MAMIKGLRAAAKYAGVSHETIRTWTNDYGIGFTSGHAHYYTEEELAPFIERAKMRALADEKIKRLQKD